MNESLRQRILSNDEVRLMLSRRANEFSRLRGCDPGGAEEDWYRAEGEILALASLIEQEIRREIESGKLLTDAPIKRREKTLKKGKAKEIVGRQNAPAAAVTPVSKAGKPSKETY